MSIIKSFSVDDGDMFYIKHSSDNFTVIDCCLYWKKDVKETIVKEINAAKAGKGISRFISTHPDDDHISGLCDFVKEVGIYNFYVVKNEATKKDPSDDFQKYCELRDGDKAFYLSKGCTRKWMNEKDETRDHSGLHCLWPITSNKMFIDALSKAKEGNDPNNISPVIKYQSNGFSFMWFGDMLSDMLTEFDTQVANTATTVLFAPHHSRKSGRIPKTLLDKLKPKLIIVGEAPSEDLEYYQGYNTITQNTSDDIRFEISSTQIDIFVKSSTYTTNAGLTDDKKVVRYKNSMYYLGSIVK